MSAPECTCLILFTNDEASIDHFPKHDAVDEVIEALSDLSQAVAEFIVEMDKTMSAPSTYERGRALAALVGKLQREQEDTVKALKTARGETERVR